MLFSVLSNVTFSQHCVVFNNKGFWLAWNSTQTNMAVARLECEGKDGVNSSDWLYANAITSTSTFDCVCWYCPLKMNSESRGTRLILAWELVWLCHAYCFCLTLAGKNFVPDQNDLEQQQPFQQRYRSCLRALWRYPVEDVWWIWTWMCTVKKKKKV